MKHNLLEKRNFRQDELQQCENCPEEFCGNSVDDFINNGYSDDDMADDDYMSDGSLKNFLRDLKKDKVLPELET